MDTKRTRIRIAIAVAGLAVSAAVWAYTRWGASRFPTDTNETLETASDALAVVCVMYVVNWILAWVYRRSWPVTLTRCLLFACVAYLAFSSLLDVFGDNREATRQILLLEPALDADAIAALRARALCALSALGLSGIAISLGFEPRSPESP